MKREERTNRKQSRPHLLLPVDGPDLIQSVDRGGQSTVHAEHLQSGARGQGASRGGEVRRGVCGDARARRYVACSNRRDETTKTEREREKKQEAKVEKEKERRKSEGREGEGREEGRRVHRLALSSMMALRLRKSKISVQ